MLFADRIRQLRGEKQLLQWQFAVARDIGSSTLFSKIERGECYAKREQVVTIAKILKYDETDFLTLWLADKIITIISNKKELVGGALKVVQQTINKKSIAKLLERIWV